MSPLMALGYLSFAAATILCLSQSLEDSDANIYSSVVASLEELKVRKFAERLGIQHAAVQMSSSVCYGELGCFEVNGTFKHLKQLPDTPEKVATQFLLYTRSNMYEPQLIDYKKPETLFKSNLDRALPIKVITHGFGGRNNLTWVWAMKNAFLKMESVNVIIVDWSLGAKVPYYITAAVNAELVGRQVAALLFFIKDNFGIHEKQMHVIGFSLGAQVVGFVGKRMKVVRNTRPARITGLDPARLFFEDYGSDVHLSAGDADFVDVIHTNGDHLVYGGVGFQQAIGDVDFYPNGGKRQPGCGSTIAGAITDVFKGERQRACNHERAVHLFTDSILYRDSSCQFIGYHCDEGYEEFHQGACMNCGIDTCGQMGYHGHGKGSYYLQTLAQSPFCAKNMKLTIHFSDQNKKSNGGIKVRIPYEKSNMQNVTITQNDEKLLPGDSRKLALALNPSTHSLNEVSITYSKYNGWFFKGTDSWMVDSLTVRDDHDNIVFNNCSRQTLNDDMEVFLRSNLISCS